MKMLEVSENKRVLTPVVYCESPESHYVAAGVKIQTQIEPRFFVGMNRVLTNMKKALIIMSPTIPDGLNTASHRSADSVLISMSTSTTMFVERKMNELKAKNNEEVYQSECLAEAGHQTFCDFSFAPLR
ncbi:hypothetical protein RB195_000191 [Necator americanus]|uniref:Uncharacterized protein n=1 Tax=Necator americanus TaxID=51031 RepID=A0ABR1D996_NECAM